MAHSAAPDERFAGLGVEYAVQNRRVVVIGPSPP